MMKSNNTNTSNVVNTKKIEVIPYNWENFGNVDIEPVEALCELVHNAYAASKSALEKRVDVEVIKTNDTKTIYVKNNGSAADIQKVLNYGMKNHDTPLNQFGTGFKTAMSYFNPENDAWEFYTRNDTAILRVKAPYSTEMVIEEIAEWPFEDWVVSCSVVSVKEDHKLNGINANELGYRYSYAIADDELYLNFNGRPVKAIFPVGHTEDAKDNLVYNINGTNVTISYHICMVKNDTHGYFGKTLADQGIYLYANNALAKKVGVSIIKKKKSRNAFIGNHPALNGIICTVNINIPEHNADLPFVNCKNAINWGIGNGPAYIDAINDAVGTIFAETHLKAIEAGKREYLDYFLSTILKSSSTQHYAIEVPINKNQTVDAVLYTKKNAKGNVDLNSVDAIIEFKKSDITGANVGQALSYVANLNKTNPCINGERRVIMVGPGLKDDAITTIQFAKSAGIHFEFCAYDFGSEELKKAKAIQKKLA